MFSCLRSRHRLCAIVITVSSRCFVITAFPLCTACLCASTAESSTIMSSSSLARCLVVLVNHRNNAMLAAAREWEGPQLSTHLVTRTRALRSRPTQYVESTQCVGLAFPRTLGTANNMQPHFCHLATRKTGLKTYSHPQLLKFVRQ